LSHLRITRPLSGVANTHPPEFSGKKLTTPPLR
jgi:hypothetical protein